MMSAIGRPAGIVLVVGEEREIGGAILVDMWPVVPRDHLIQLKDLGCPQFGMKRESRTADRRRLA
jgi:hypothetical protein